MENSDFKSFQIEIYSSILTLFIDNRATTKYQPIHILKFYLFSRGASTRQ